MLTSLLLFTPRYHRYGGTITIVSLLSNTQLIATRVVLWFSKAKQALGEGSPLSLFMVVPKCANAIDKDYLFVPKYYQPDAEESDDDDEFEDSVHQSRSMPKPDASSERTSLPRRELTSTLAKQASTVKQQAKSPAKPPTKQPAKPPTKPQTKPPAKPQAEPQKKMKTPIHYSSETSYYDDSSSYNSSSSDEEKARRSAKQSKAKQATPTMRKQQRR